MEDVSWAKSQAAAGSDSQEIRFRLAAFISFRIPYLHHHWP
jgi:hypothetical protein